MQAPWPEVRERKEYSMNGRILLLVVMASLALAVFAPAAIAQDDDDDDDDDYGAATATATATATAYADDDDGVAAAAGGSLPRTGGPALVAPIAGALLIGGGVAGVVALRRSRNAP
jgi:LPXTG-motif cell wall-anchored protein